MAADPRLIALRSAPPVFSSDEAEHIARDQYGLTVTARSLPGERDGNFHLQTADGEDFVLKILDATAEPEATECQIRVLRHLATQDPALPVPRVVATLFGGDLGRVTRSERHFATGLYTYLNGSLLGDVPPSMALLHDVGRTLARVDRALCGFFHRALGQRIAWDVRRLPEIRAYLTFIQNAAIRRHVETVCDGFVSRLGALAGLESQAIHGDGHGGNILVNTTHDQVRGLLDFGDMIHGPRVLEPAVAMAEVPTQGLATEDALSSLLSGYVTTLPLVAADIEVLYDLILARQASTLLIQAWRVHHGAGADLLTQSARHAAAALDWLMTAGRLRLTQQWHDVAGTTVRVQGPVSLERRHRLLGAGAELFYEQPLHLVRGSGVWLFDSRDQAYLDVYNNVPHVGHCHPAVVRAIQRQTATLATHTRYLHGGILDYADALTARCPPDLDACIFVNSGSEANDIAWRLARLATGHDGAVIMAHAYHGITDAVAALTPVAGTRGDDHDPRVVALDPPTVAGYQEPMSEADLALTADGVDRAVRRLAARGHAPAAFFLDTALTSSGIYDAPPEWMRAVADRLRAAGCLIVADEVQYGLGRSGANFWGFERRGLRPDIVTLGKPIGNGYPMGAVITRRTLIEAFQAKYGFFSTFGGNAVAASAGLAVLDVIDRERLVDNARSTGEYLRERLERLASQHACLGRVRGTGLLLGLEVLGPDAASAKARTRQIINAMKNHARVLIGYEGPAADILKLRPPLSFQPAHADLLAAAIGDAAAQID